MYISKIELNKIRCFKHFSIELEKDGTPILWTTILGDNAVGKTCLLRSIALGLCDEASAAALMKELPGDILQQGELEGWIKITLKKEESNKDFTITTNITKKSPSSPEKVSQCTSPEKEFPWKDVFICGYGSQRATGAERGFFQYIPLEAVYTLFNYESSLQNPEIILLRQEPSFRQQLVDKLLKILMLDENDNSIEFTKKGIIIHGPWGALPLGVLSDGYRSTTYWVIDFVGWQIYAEKIDVEEKISGIVLIDEIEQHLHPKWQQSIVHRLKEQFSNVQFITTTHSPLVASSIGQLTTDKGQDKLLHLARKDENNIEMHELDTLKGLDIDQVLASKAFDYLINADPEVEKVLAEASELAGKGDKRSSEENERYKEIKSALKKILRPEGRTLIEREIQKELYQEMKEQIKELEQKLFADKGDKRSAKEKEQPLFQRLTQAVLRFFANFFTKK